LHDRQPSGRQAQAAQPDQADSGSPGDHETVDRVRDVRHGKGRAQQLQVSRVGPATRQLRMAHRNVPAIKKPSEAERPRDLRHAESPRMPARSTPMSLLLSLRPSQWTKNLIVFAGLLFGQRGTRPAFVDPQAILLSLAAFGIFCALSGLVYLIN